MGHTRHAACVMLREREEGDGEFGLHLQCAALCIWRGDVGGVVIDGGEWAQDARARAEGDEGGIRAYVSDDRIQLPARVPKHNIQRGIEPTNVKARGLPLRTYGRTLCSW